MFPPLLVQRHLWLTLSDIPDRDQTIYLDEPISTEGLFGQSLIISLPITSDLNKVSLLPIAFTGGTNIQNVYST